jgi:hypothetical protein
MEVLAARTGFRRLEYSGRKTQISSACPLDIPLSYFHTHSIRTINYNYNNKKAFQAHQAFSTADCYHDYQAQTASATPTATDCVTPAEISPSFNLT